MTPYYEADGIVIYHGDCRDVLPTIDPASVSLVIADPPYGVGAVQRNGRPRHGKDTANSRAPGTWRAWQPIEGDAGPFAPLHLLPFPRLVLFGANHYASRLPDSGSWLVWDKREDATPDDNADAELIWTNLGGPVRTYRQCWRGFTRARDGLEPVKHVHPTQKPVNLMMWLLERYTKPGDLILDPYMGSGPIPKACQILGRRCIAMDVVEAYCATAAQRLSQSVLPLAMSAD